MKSIKQALAHLPLRDSPECIIEFTWNHLIQALQPELITAHIASSHRPETPFSITTDTRTLSISKKTPQTSQKQPFQNISYPSPANPKIQLETSNPLFVALDGTRFKGIDFLIDAYNQGVKHFIFDHSYIETPNFSPPQTSLTLKKWLQKHNLSYITVKHTLKALGRLAQYKLHFLDGIKIAITGSAGKTSTKDFLKQLLQINAHSYSSPQNFNNTLGLPLSILAINEPYDYYLFEMGMNAPGEISWLSEIVQPDCSILTNILPAHIGPLGSIKKIALAKCEILQFQRSTPFPNPTKLNSKHKALTGKVFYPSNIHEISLIKKLIQKHTLEAHPYHETNFNITATLNSTSQLTSALTDLETSKTIHLKTPSPFLPALASLGKKIVQILNLPSHTLKTALETYKGSSRRLEVKHIQPYIVDDAYNANPKSMEEVIRFFLPLTKHPAIDNLIFILGDMLELGDKEVFFHQQLAQSLNTILTSKNIVFCYGKRMLHTYNHLNSIKKYHFLTPNTLLQTLLTYTHSKNILIFKGSNGMQMKTLIDKLLQKHLLTSSTPA